MRKREPKTAREREEKRESGSLGESPTSPRAILIGKVRNISYEIFNV